MRPSSELMLFHSASAQLAVDPYGDQIISANQEACYLLQEDGSALQRMRASDFFAESLSAWIVFTEECIVRGRAWNDRLKIHLADESVVRLEVVAKYANDESDSFLLISFVKAEEIQLLRERSEAQLHYESGIAHWDRISQVFREFERENQLILNAAGEGIYGVDLEGNTTFVNAAAHQILGWNERDLIGKNIHTVIHHTRKNGEHFHVKDCSIYQAIRDGVIRTVEDEVFWTKGGKPIDVEYTSTPIEDQGQLMGAVVVFRDVTQKRIDREKLVAAIQEVETLKNRLEMENAYLQEEINSEFNHHQLVGKSPVIQQTLQKITLVAPTNATVLVTGESGTGKELIARAIHEMSERSDRSLIRVNCAAIPADLFESEFFGHSKGAFTGATDARVGRFELADGGTIFLDEVGEIPFALQGKLLRVLQEQSFERVGESNTRTVDVRIIAATNRNLQESVSNNRFREDLYFRLNVFPIESVPLRGRKMDIPLLAQHFLNKNAKKNNKENLKISASQMDKLQAYSWPGNIRELENVIERQVILSRDKNLRFDDLPRSLVSDVAEYQMNTRESKIITEDERIDVEVENIKFALRQCMGKVSGEGGAAQVLNLKPTTLSSRLKKFGIDARSFKSSEACNEKRENSGADS